MKPKIDCVICAMPSVKISGPPLAPYLLKGYLESLCFSIKALDLNLDFWKRIEKIGTNSIHIKTKMSDETGPIYDECLRPIIETWATRLVELKASWVGLSLFSVQGELMIEKLASLIKMKNPSQKIVVGGPGVRLVEKQFLQKENIDVFIKGDGEYALESLLSRETNIQGVNGNGFAKEVIDMDSMPFPDFSEVDFNDYDNPNPFVYIKGSKGCVRKCKFCDTTADVSRYRYRAGENVARELIHNYNTYSISNFIFSDSLINGRVKELRSMCEALIAYYSKADVKPFSWFGHFIIRPQSQMRDSDYELLKKAGCSYLKAGVESGSERVRKEMRKHFSQEDLSVFLKRCSKVNLQVLIHLVVGYPTETDADFLDTLKVVDMLAEYKDILRSIKIGSTISILPGTYLFDNSEEMGIKFNHHKSKSKYMEKQWEYGDNTFLRRLERQKKLIDHIANHGLADIILDPLNNTVDDLLSEYDEV